MHVKTREEHLCFLQNMVKLKLWFVAKWKYENPQESVSEIINIRTLIMNYTEFNSEGINADISQKDKPKGWIQLVDELSDLYRTMKPKGDYEKYEQAAFSLVAPALHARIERDLDLFNTVYLSEDSRQGSCFFFVDEADHSPEASYLAQHFGDGRTFMRCHQWNSRYPQSYLTDPDFFRHSLIKLIDDTEACGAIGIYGTGWMNLFPAFSRQFPPEWRNNAIGPIYDIKGNLGCWGQFISADYTFQHKMGARYRRTQIIPFPSTLCFAKATEFRSFFSIPR